jgi:hypothetical protein
MTATVENKREIRAIEFSADNLNGDLDKIIEYLSGLRKALAVQGYTNYQMNVSMDIFENEIVSEITYEKS